MAAVQVYGEMLNTNDPSLTVYDTVEPVESISRGFVILKQCENNLGYVASAVQGGMIIKAIPEIFGVFGTVLQPILMGGQSVTVVPVDRFDENGDAVPASGNEDRSDGSDRKECDKKYEYKFVEPVDLTVYERAIYDMTPGILAMTRIDLGGIMVRISEIIKSPAIDCTVGVWDLNKGFIIKRDELASAERYAGTLMHLVASSTSTAPRPSREFEEVLTTLLGRMAAAAVGAQGPSKVADRPRKGFWRRGGS